ncbi:hypothetical protein [Polyangium jinanense]|uniref:Secreted protein n=1 Tax=Polyangium jinanense TaxID=2829994 RepID=A0A9X3X9T0_9BACT|nr:hypothetical protein [Polyangium jinanense]MDC3960513.1 hypothetical protein [Polyangium jinanense]MDC3985375.1 hypothetical protein [Polyangium jinanense]
MYPLATVLVPLSAAVALFSYAHALAYAPDDTGDLATMHVYFSTPLPKRIDLLLDGKPCVSISSSRGTCTVTATPTSACYVYELALSPNGCFDEEGGKLVTFQVHPEHRPRVSAPYTMVARFWTEEGITMRAGRTAQDFYVPQPGNARVYYGVVHF